MRTFLTVVARAIATFIVAMCLGLGTLIIVMALADGLRQSGVSPEQVIWPVICLGAGWLSWDWAKAILDYDREGK